MRFKLSSKTRIFFVAQFKNTDGQSVDVQVRQLRVAGYERIFRETASGAKTDRAELSKALAKFHVGDMSMVTRLGRLA